MSTELALLALLRENLNLRRQLATDALTGVGSRSAYQTRVIAPGQSYIVVDVDKFKAINDTHGHAVGDGVLAAIASLIRAEGDRCYRTGGDEFVVVLDGPLAAAATVAQRIQQAIAAQPIEGIHCTVSVGVGATEAQADAAMYCQKRAA